MGHTLSINYRKVEFVDAVTEHVLPTEPVFFESYNFNEIIGIYPEPYDYGEGEEGYFYNCYIANTASKKIKHVTIADWWLKNLDNDKVKEDMVQILVFDKCYSSVISEATFNKYLKKTLGDILPPTFKFSFKEKK